MLHGIGSVDVLEGRCGAYFFSEACSRDRACSIAWIMHRPPKPGTAGSNPAAPANRFGLWSVVLFIQTRFPDAFQLLRLCEEISQNEF